MICALPPPPPMATEVHAAAHIAYWQGQCVERLTELNGPYRERGGVRASAEVSNRVSTPPPPGVEQWRPLVAAHFPPELVEPALRVMACESGGDPWAYNPSSASGLFQIKTFWTSEFAGDLFDPNDNVRIAAAIWTTYGSQHWVCRP